MLARCANCGTIFRIGAEQLKAGRGLVRCGICHTLFDALDQLQDDYHIPVPEGDRSRTEEPRAASRAQPSVPGTAGPATGGALGKLEMPELEMPRLAPRERQEPREKSPSPGRPKAKRPPARPPLEELPLWDDTTRGERGGWLWGAGVAAMAILLIGQVLWFRGGELLGRFPGLREPVEQAWALFGCELPARRDVKVLRLLSRDVRAHPRFRDALLVNATFANESGFAQPYPVLELGLFDTHGAMLGVRRFQPAEYLDPSIGVGAGMAPGSAVHITLEIAAAKQPATSFEFKFL